MKFTVKIRPMSAADASLQCPFPPNTTEYNDAVAAFLGDIGRTTWCISISNEHDGIIEIEASINSVFELKTVMKSTFSEYFCYIRFVDSEIKS